MEDLLNSSTHDGVILYGEGGIGKTRLMLELGNRAQKVGWLVFRITPELDSLKTLAASLEPGTRNLLLFDYIEENRHFRPELPDRLRELCPDAVFRILGNCRNSHIKS